MRPVPSGIVAQSYPIVICEHAVTVPVAGPLPITSTDSLCLLGAQEPALEHSAPAGPTDHACLPHSPGRGVGLWGGQVGQQDTQASPTRRLHARGHRDCRETGAGVAEVGGPFAGGLADQNQGPLATAARAPGLPSGDGVSLDLNFRVPGGPSPAPPQPPSELHHWAPRLLTALAPWFSPVL